MIELKGTHGTCKSACEDIAANGFRQGAGVRGTGVYFWDYPSDLKCYATELARGWWKRDSVNGKYKQYVDKSLGIIYATISTKEDAFLDLGGHEMCTTLVRFLNEYYKRNVQEGRDKKYNARAYDAFIKLIERKANVNVNVVRTLVNPPSKEYLDKRIVSSDLIGSPSCLMVRNSGCIKVEEIQYK